MGEKTAITWTDHTLNPWIGCAKVSAGCAHCYAEKSPAVTFRTGLKLWGADGVRVETKGWESNLRRWDRAAARDGVRRRVFCASLADVFEDRPDPMQLRDIRFRLFDAIGAVRSLDIQLLTKRPQNVLPMVPPSWLDRWPAHVWIGTTAEDQAAWDRRLPALAEVPAPVRFVSVEPQIGPIDATRWIGWIQWLIDGGESGPRARPFDIAWMRSLRDQCRAAGVPFFPKQLGACAIDPINGIAYHDRKIAAEVDGFIPRVKRVALCDSHGGDESEWPADLRGLRAFPVRP